jgi:hypothetical protein
MNFHGRSWTFLDDRGRWRNFVMGRSRDGQATVTGWSRSRFQIIKNTVFRGVILYV